jgi:alkylated DNA nucleotide flippase Atl1
MNAQLEAQVKFHKALAEAHRTFADELLAAANEPAVNGDAVAIPEARGHRQTQILGLPGLTAEEGMKTADIAAAIGYEVPNTYQTLQGLAQYVEMVPDKVPQRWRLRAPYRADAETFKGIAALVGPGEWTTYGDISIVVRGDTKAARGVGRAAAMLPDFPNPHRVLRETGEIHDRWKDAEGRGPDYCRKLLEAEGVHFSGDGRADRAQYISWPTLKERRGKS